ncbi:hypothetical protein PENTCL1PPCAC_1481, partial [Pristionchus entomophagus]
LFKSQKSMSTRRSDNELEISQEEEIELLMDQDGEAEASPELNEEEEEALMGKDGEEEGDVPRGGSAEEELRKGEEHQDGDGNHELEDGEEDELMMMDEDGEANEEFDEHENPQGEKPLDYDGDEEEERELKFEEEEDGSRRSTRSTRQSASVGLEDDDPLDEDDELDDEEEEEREYDEDDEKKKSKEDHPTLLAQAGEGIIHVGTEYQAMIAESDLEKKSAREDEDRDTALWLPPPGGLNEDELVEFCEEAMGIYMLTFDRALYILQNSDYNYKKALDTISCRKTVREEWSEDDNQLFRQAYALYGKNFARIRQTMPHRSMSSIIHHYYSTKKQQDYKSLVDSKIDKTGFNLEEREPDLTDGGKCENCHETVKKLFLIDDGKQCNTCMLYFKLMLKPRPVPKEELPEGRTRRRGLKLAAEYMDIVEDFVALAEHMPEPDNEPASKKSRHDNIHMSVCVFQSKKTKVHAKMREMEQEMLRCRTRTVRLEQAIKQRSAQLADRVTFDKLRAQIEKAETDKGRVRMQYTWTDQEKIMAFHCFVRYGRDFEAVAEVVGTKTPDMVKSLYTELKDDIDKIIDEAEEADAQEAANADREAVLGTRKEPVEVVDLD